MNKVLDDHMMIFSSVFFLSLDVDSFPNALVYLFNIIRIFFSDKTNVDVKLAFK